MVLPSAFVPSRVMEEAAILAAAPARLRALVMPLSPAQLDTKYRNWTVRQIVHHLADSHMHVYIRWKLALTEETPRIAPYDETQWSELVDAKTAGIEHSLGILDGVHARWDMVIKAMKPDDFNRAFFHPQRNANIPLWQATAMYSWHMRHHTAQIEWLRDHYRW